MPHSSPLPRLGPESRLSDFFRGAMLPFRAVRLVFGQPKLFRLSLVALAVTLVALIALVSVLGTWTDDLVRRWLFSPESWYGEVAFWLLVVVVFRLLLVVGLNTVPLILLAPLQDPLSEATEEACGDFKAPQFSVGGLLRGAWVALAHTVSRVGLLLGGSAVLLLLNLVPGIGSALWTGSSIAWTVYWLAAEYLDAPMARHLYPFREVPATVRRRLPLCLGFGAAIYVLMWIPVLNLFFIPLAVVAGTLLYRGLRAAGSVAAPPTVR